MESSKYYASDKFYRTHRKKTRGHVRSPSPPIKYGTPKVQASGISKSYRQHDERFHGAFTGGFSAGYYNSVGSKDGWTPQEGFISSLGNRVDFSQKPDVTAYMDDEDWNEQNLTASRRLNDLDNSDGNGDDRNQILDLFLASSTYESFNKMSAELMSNLGWYKYSQGTVDSQFDINQYKKLSSGKKKQYGLGFEGTGHTCLPCTPKKLKTRVFFNKVGKLSSAKSSIKIQHGDSSNNSDESDEDSFPAIKISSSGNLKRKPALTEHRFPKLLTAPRTLTQENIREKICFDGSFPIDGFVIGSIDLSKIGHYFDPKVISTTIPENWKPRLKNTISLKSSNEEPIINTLFSDDRLPKKTVFDYLTPDQREKIVKLTGNKSLPPGKSEAAKYMASPKPTLSKDFSIPTLSVFEATAALANPRLPYVNDETKRSRYLRYLKFQQKKLLESSILKLIPEGLTDNQWISELGEFSKTAKLSGSFTGLMNQKFVSAKPQTVSYEIDAGCEDSEVIISSSHTKSSTPVASIMSEASTKTDAAVSGNYGELTRSVASWVPDSLLAKRLGIVWIGNVRFPSTLESDTVPGETNDSFPELPPGDTSVHDSTFDSFMSEDLKPEFNAILERKPESKNLFESIFGDIDDTVENDDDNGW
ncbi:DUF1604-domain-containing protein [Nadsonia fulvescens var. elongata DSM 6958]|uniref:DUF1604-domain-containing protein n=1 Tax=Nadsonia fulvescens var. elongata DSM 6958 TaxID=857566 RepID=A0A1E3PLA7_9ASCO|nr:DUF1604-domain-containing protein [Nadsonia fulvescens var. elongata DSM 6958]